MSIEHEALVVNVQIGVWQASRLISSKSSDGKAEKVEKLLVPRTALTQITAICNQIRGHTYGMTLPWKLNGDRLLPRHRLNLFLRQHEALVADFDKAVDDFVGRVYASAREKAKFHLRKAFNPSEYPNKAELKSRFYVHLDLDPISLPEHLALTQSKTAADRLRKTMADEQAERVGRLMDQVWSDLVDKLAHLAHKLNADEIFRDATVTNLEDYLDDLPHLNLIHCPRLDAVAADIRRNVLTCDPKELRRDVLARATAGAEAQRILDEIASGKTKKRAA